MHTTNFLKLDLLGNCGKFTLLACLKPTFDEKYHLIITIFLKKNLSNEERFYMTMLEITGPNQFYNYSIGPVSVHRHAA